MCNNLDCLAISNILECSKNNYKFTKNLFKFYSIESRKMHGNSMIGKTLDADRQKIYHSKKKKENLFSNKKNCGNHNVIKLADWGTIMIAIIWNCQVFVVFVLQMCALPEEWNGILHSWPVLPNHLSVRGTLVSLY